MRAKVKQNLLNGKNKIAKMLFLPENCRFGALCVP